MKNSIKYLAEHYMVEQKQYVLGERHSVLVDLQLYETPAKLFTNIFCLCKKSKPHVS